MQWDFRDSTVKGQYIALLRRLHGLNVRFPSEFCPIQTIRTYMIDAIKMEVDLPQNLFNQLLPILEGLQQMDLLIERVPCHLDPQIANILAVGDKVYFVDWECAVMCDPYMDLASLCASEEFSDGEMGDILALYLQRQPLPEEYDRLYHIRILADIRMSLICYLQTKIKPSQENLYRGFAEGFLKSSLNRLKSYTSLIMD